MEAAKEMKFGTKVA